MNITKDTYDYDSNYCVRYLSPVSIPLWILWPEKEISYVIHPRANFLYVFLTYDKIRLMNV